MELNSILDFAKFLKLRTGGVFDPVRQKWIAMTPEEKVRQCLIFWLNAIHHIPFGRMAVEKKILVFNQMKRFDLVVFDRELKAKILFECKEPGCPIQQSIFNQAAVYNYELKAPFLGICNGHELILAEIDFHHKSYRISNRLPTYPF